MSLEISKSSQLKDPQEKIVKAMWSLVLSPSHSPSATQLCPSSMSAGRAAQISAYVQTCPPFSRHWFSASTCLIESGCNAVMQRFGFDNVNPAGQLVSGPKSPRGPCGPSWPSTPSVPFRPGVPLVPLVPLTPSLPRQPRMVGRQGGPMGPCSPGLHCTPWSPCNPRSPCSPAWP